VGGKRSICSSIRGGGGQNGDSAGPKVSSDELEFYLEGPFTLCNNITLGRGVATKLLLIKSAGVAAQD